MTLTSGLRTHVYEVHAHMYACMHASLYTYYHYPYISCKEDDTGLLYSADIYYSYTYVFLCLSVCMYADDIVLNTSLLLMSNCCLECRDSGNSASKNESVDVRSTLIRIDSFQIHHMANDFVFVSDSVTS